MQQSNGKQTVEYYKQRAENTRNALVSIGIILAGTLIVGGLMLSTGQDHSSTVSTMISSTPTFDMPAMLTQSAHISQTFFPTATTIPVTTPIAPAELFKPGTVNTVMAILTPIVAGGLILYLKHKTDPQPIIPEVPSKK